MIPQTVSRVIVLTNQQTMTDPQTDTTEKHRPTTALRYRCEDGNHAYVVHHLPPTKEEVYVFARAPAFVCLCGRLLKNACMDLDEMLRGTGFLSPIAYALKRGNVELYYVGKSLYMYWYWGPVEAATRGF